MTPMPAQAPGKAAAWPLQYCARDLAAAAQCRHTTAGVSAPCCFCRRKLKAAQLQLQTRQLLHPESKEQKQRAKACICELGKKQKQQLRTEQEPSKQC